MLGGQSDPVIGRNIREFGAMKGRRNHVLVKLQDVRNKEMHFWVRRDEPIRQVFLEYCHREGMNYDAMRFAFDGIRVKESHTPKDLGMEDGDIINVFTDQTGGSY